jgi:hypothetical protein
VCSRVNERAKSYPIVILGMHRSGTTLLVSLLQRLGLFCGMKMGKNQEALFFQRRNEWLMRRSGGAWDNPTPTKFIIENNRLRSQAVGILGQAVNSWRFSEFVGLKKYLADSASSLHSIPWGWKDPRTIFTFPLWREVFPQTRVLYIRRNGVDVAASLFTRQQLILKGSGRTSLSIPPLLERLKGAFSPVEWYVLQSPRCCSVEGAFGLWEEYMLEAETLFSGYDGGKLAVSYEHFLSNPKTVLEQIGAFCELPASEKQISDAAKTVTAERAFAFAQNRELWDFYLSVKNNHLMQKLGYGSVISY